jgi:hypothetical protein
VPAIPAAVDILIAMYRKDFSSDISKDETVVKVVICPSEMKSEEEVTAELS